MDRSNSFLTNKPDSITTEEVMADFLDAISKIYSNSMLLKGCMALYIHSDLKTNLRKTRDLDFNFFYLEDWEDFCENSFLIATKFSKLKFTYAITKRRGFDKNPSGDSLKFKASKDGQVIEFKIDMNIGGNELSELNSELTRSPINLYSVYGILSDKLKVLSERKLCRRIKDLIDVYYISTTMCIDFKVLVDAILFKYKEEILGNLNPCFVLDLENYDQIKYAYDKYDIGDIKKEDFEVVYAVVVYFVSPVYEFLLDRELCYSSWSKEELLWLR